MPPDNHRRIITEKGIQTAKGHIVSMQCWADPKFPMHLWDRLLRRMELQLDLLQQLNTVPIISSYAHIGGPYDYNAHPLAPLALATAVAMYIKPGKRTSFGQHSVSGLYVGSSIKDTNRVWIVGNTVFFKHNYLTMTTVTAAGVLLHAAKDLPRHWMETSHSPPLSERSLNGPWNSLWRIQPCTKRKK